MKLFSKNQNTKQHFSSINKVNVLSFDELLRVRGGGDGDESNGIVKK